MKVNSVLTGLLQNYRDLTPIIFSREKKTKKKTRQFQHLKLYVYAKE